MKKRILVLALALGSNPAMAQLVTLDPAALVQSIFRYTQMIASYAQQAKQLENDVLQYQSMLKNLANNPMGAVTPNYDILVRNQARIMADGQKIGNSMATVSGGIDKTFTNPQGSYQDKFKGWTNGSGDALKGAMLNAGLHREEFADDTTALRALVDKNQASEGNLGALKTLGEINGAQLQESMKLRDLISGQQLATNSFMMAQASKDQARLDNNRSIMGTGAKPIPKFTNKNSLISK